MKTKSKEIKKVVLEPEFITTLRSGGNVEILTIPKSIIEAFNLQKGKQYKIRLLAEIEIPAILNHLRNWLKITSQS